MRAATIIFLLSIYALLGQEFDAQFTFSQQFVAPATAGFNPTSSIANVWFYLDYNSLPQNAKPTAWTNLVGNGAVFTNQGSTIPTNSASGVYFDGDVLDYFKNSGSGVRWSNAFDSTWILLKVVSIDHAYDSILANQSTSGYGLYASSATAGFRLYNGSGDFAANAPLNVQIDICLVPNGSGGVNGYTNGVQGASISWAEVVNTPVVWGIGLDADGDKSFHGYMKFIGIWTNYTFTTTDISNLHYYATTH